MKVKHENIELIESWLISNNYEVSFEADFIRKVYDEVLENSFDIRFIESVKRRSTAYKQQYDFVRRDLLKILYKRNGYSAKGIKAGFVYAIGNPAWGDFIKVGSAVDVIDRLNSYQTSSPFRDYYLISYFFTEDRLESEKEVHEMFDRNSEWCKVSVEDVKELFKSLRNSNSVEVLEEKLYKVKNELALKKLMLDEEAVKRKVAKLAKRARFRRACKKDL